MRQLTRKNKIYINGFFPEFELRRRETGFKCKIGWENRIKHALYSSLLPSTSWDPIMGSVIRTGKSQGVINVHHGGVFNLEYSPDGKQLVAACEKNAIMVFDPLTRRRIYDVENAHSNCVNCIKFLDNRVFASCSDDKTAALWDVRNLKSSIVKLSGHLNWVKNIEYSSEDGLLVTSGFDGRILGWDINSYTESSLMSKELFRMNGLMRVRLTPDMQKLVICTSSGYMVLINNLSLNHLLEDLDDFQPNTYRLLQLRNFAAPSSMKYRKLFYAKRNRVEFVSDFPVGNDAEVIHSLQVHPQGWSVLSRNTSIDNSSEWTCIHDIQDVDSDTLKKIEEDDKSEISDPNIATYRSYNERSNYLIPTPGFRLTNDFEPIPVRTNINEELSSRIELPIRSLRSRDPVDSDEEEFNEMNRNYYLGNRRSASRESARATSDTPGPSRAPSLSSSNRDLASYRRTFAVRRRRANIAARRRSRNPRLRGRRVPTLRNEEESEDQSPQSGNESPLNEYGFSRESMVALRTGLNNDRAVLFVPPDSNVASKGIIQNTHRLTNYIEEPNKVRGFIKELCFSSDGRLICSPFDCGVRLLMFDSECSELSHCVGPKPRQLCAVSTNICHNSCVVSTKFSPVDCQLVSGCLNGKIVWHQPVI